MISSHPPFILEALKDRNHTHALVSSSHVSPHPMHRLWSSYNEAAMPLLDPQQINLQALVEILNMRFQESAIVLPRISPLPILRARWTRNGPLLTLRVEEKRTMFRYLTPHEWLSLLHVTGAFSAYIRLHGRMVTPSAERDG